MVVKAVVSAIHGRRVEWGSLQRTASAVVDTRGDSAGADKAQAKPGAPA